MNKITSKSAVVLLLMLWAFSAIAQPVSITGLSKSYAGEEIVFYHYSDLITMTEEEIGRCRVESSGAFSCQIKVNETTYLFSHLGIYRIYLFAEPGKTYNLALPTKESKSESQRLNPYFRETDMFVGITNIDKNDINYLTNSFDLSFNEKFDLIINDTYKGKPNINIDSLINTLESRYAQFKIPYFNIYRYYRYGLLKQLTYIQKARSTSEHYFLNKPVMYNNTAFMELFNLVYDKYFIFFSRTEKGDAVFKNISQDKSYSALNKTLSTDNVLSNDTLKELVILKGLHDGFFDDKFSRSALLTILDSLYFTTKIPEHLVIAENIRTKVTHLLAGFVPAPFELYDSKGKLIKLDDFKGKYVYLNFCTTSSYTCLQEFTILQKLYEKHKQLLEIITVCVDNDKEDISNLLKNTGYDWTFLHYGNKPEIVKDFDIRAYPTYFLIGPDRKLLLSPAPSPREDFEVRLFKILRSRGDI
ncbi:MAG: TlpA family protein disulfide reductase [Bacteroidales bacterium]|nr:MAG: TlpA family protein disulfide reductase [Bacteroidales bacterium]